MEPEVLLEPLRNPLPSLPTSQPMNIRPLRLSCWVVLALLLLPAVAARADKNPKGLADDIKRQEKEIAEAHKKLNAAKGEADAAKAALKKSQGALERATSKVGDVRRSVQAEHDAAPSLVAARKKVETDRAALEQHTAPILERLKQSPAYRDAVVARDQAKSELGTLPSSATTQERVAVGKKYSDAIAVVRQLEKAAIDADPKAKAARAAVDDAEASGRHLIEKRDQAIDQDARLKSAKNDLDSAKSDLAKAKSKAESESRQLASAKNHLDSEEKQKKDLEHKRQQQKNNNKKPQGKKK